MALRQAYAVWNNKGGVGKSTITFHLASRYAELNPKTNVLVIDLCPQANASMMLLGGGTSGEGLVLQLCRKETPKTVVGYLAQVIGAGPGAPLPDPKKWIVPVNDHNKHIPGNVYLMCGDGNLEPMAPLIAERASQPALTAASDPWKWVHSVVRQFIDNLVESDTKDWMVFIDTNPSFSIYTEIAVCGASRLIVPVNADDSSRVAVNAMFTLLHGSNPPHPVYGSYTFAEKAKQRALKIPQVHLIVGNRLTVYEGPAKAFKAMSDATAEALYEAWQQNSSRFSAPRRKIKDVKTFRDAFAEPLRDFNTAGVVSAHLGCPMSALKDDRYDVHADKIRVNARDLTNCLTAINAVLEML
jgi:cellulose biosynthesis protein BcsQ